ncbi:uncharacterized protein LOC128127931 [Lactuca sativa]|uniref:uncharacterized protein LOC128127931 n=1 Tax=Lactuca sativa TaxID=4236 RepID=UPI0022AEB65B|nr:uncharacterized protein LOC128127931 [Lactuca sativa]
MGAEEPVRKEPPHSGTSVEGENLSSSNEQDSHIQGENPIIDAPESPSAPESPVAPESPSAPESPVAPESPYAPESPVEERFLGSSSIEGENSDMLYDDDIQSELEEMVNAELNPSYDPNYPPLTKWTRDHPLSQVVGDASENVLTRSQLKAKQAALFSKVEFCILGSLAIVSKGKGFVKEEEELDLADYDLTGEEYALMVSNPRKFIKR